VLPQLTNLRGAALNLLFPQYCLGCGKEESFICSDCSRNLPYIFCATCPTCGAPQTNGVTCARCLERHPEIDGIQAPFRFEGVIREAIHQLKYQNLRAIAPGLAVFIQEFLEDHPVEADLLVPVPLHPKRLRERGYNQSALLTRELGGLLHLPVDEKSLVRRHYVSPQARTRSVSERFQNVMNLFECSPAVVYGKSVIIMDDVTTSGATLNACAAALKKAGAIRVLGLALAKEI
ncbi:MAG: ComF family protein, partial [Dehalococcoidales bacterium]|nr:ComF family protein [Dehalococcoidales bacterium]